MHGTGFAGLALAAARAVSPRRRVALAVGVVAGGLLAGVLLRLQGAGGDPGRGSLPASDALGEEIRSGAPAPAFSTEVALPVRGARVREDTFTLWVEAEGTVEARRRATLRAESPGPVRSVAVGEGGFVQHGELVARIDPSPYLLDVQEAQARYEEARAEFHAMTSGGGRMELTGDEREERRRHARIRSGLVRAEVELAKARHEVAKTRIRAPFAGRVANLTVSEGARLAPRDSVATVLDLSQVDVDVEVLQTRVTQLERGRRARVRFIALPGDTFPGRVVSLNPLVDPESETVRVTVRLENPEARVLPGMHASVEIAGRRYADRTFVPRDAIVERDRRAVVFTFAPSDPADGTGRAEWTYVATGLESDRFVEILPDEGGDVPGAGAVVLVEGHTTLAHGARVRVDNWSRLAGPGS